MDVCGWRLGERITADLEKQKHFEGIGQEEGCGGRNIC
jgi:hypothetical protein